MLGTLAGVALARLGRFRGTHAVRRLDLRAAGRCPTSSPGLSLLLLFVDIGSLGWPAARLTTIVLAHVTFGMAYVAVVVQSRLVDPRPALEEAAMDLGAPPLKTFLVITLPLIAPALVGGWLLAFTLSLDDLVIASFTPARAPRRCRCVSSARCGSA